MKCLDRKLTDGIPSRQSTNKLTDGIPSRQSTNKLTDGIPSRQSSSYRVGSLLETENSTILIHAPTFSISNQVNGLNCTGKYFVKTPPRTPALDFFLYFWNGYSESLFDFIPPIFGNQSHSLYNDNSSN